MESSAKDIICCSEVATTARYILGKDRCTCKAKDVVFLELLDDSCVHIAKLRTMAFIEHHHHILAEDLMGWESLNQRCELLYCGDNNLALRILQLTFQYLS